MQPIPLRSGLVRLHRILASALVVPVIPVLAAAPAYAVDNVICVGSPEGPCNSTETSINAAIAAANGNGLPDTIRVGAGTYTETPYVLNGTTEPITLEGSGAGTILTMAPGASQDYVWANHATVRDLTVVMEPTTPANDTGVDAYGGSVIENVIVDGTGTANANGVNLRDSQLTDSTVQMALDSGSRAVYGEGGSSVIGSMLVGDTAFNHSGTGTPDVVSRSTLRVGYAAGVSTDSGTVEIDSSVIDLNTHNGTGLRAANFNNSTTPKAIDADHVTIVGGTAGSEGVWAYAARSTALQTTDVTMTNSIIRGPATSLVADAGNDGAQGGDSSATINVSHTDYQTTGGTIDANGVGGVLLGAGNMVDVDPAFVDATAGDFRLTEGSPVIDQGDPAAGLPGDLDRDGNAREVDGDQNGSVVRDPGAYEFADLVAPQTTITGGPAAPTRDTTPTFTFTSEPGATFACQVDAGPPVACTSPFTTPALANGAHTFRVRATDGWDNADATPATRTFKVDTVAPQTTITKKPAKVITKRRARFAFTSSETGSTFQCRLDSRAWRACASPKVVRVKKGRHVFRVRAIDAAGNVDATPAVYRFRRA